MLFNATSGTLDLQAPQTKVKSNGNRPGTVFTFETDRTAKLSITAQSRHLALWKASLLANSVAVEAATANTATLPAMTAGQVFMFDEANVSNVVITGKTEGTDYILDAKSGVIEALTTFTAGVEVTYDSGAYDNLGVFSAEAQEYEVIFYSEKSGQSYRFFNAKGSPAGAFALLQDGNGVGTATLDFELQIDPTAPDTGDLGQYGRARNVD